MWYCYVCLSQVTQEVFNGARTVSSVREHYRYQLSLYVKIRSRRNKETGGGDGDELSQQNEFEDDIKGFPEWKFELFDQM